MQWFFVNFNFFRRKCENTIDKRSEVCYYKFTEIAFMR
nr:MAG TPA: hypothetical protein [Caudoviricetes sp.]